MILQPVVLDDGWEGLDQNTKLEYNCHVNHFATAALMPSMDEAFKTLLNRIKTSEPPIIQLDQRIEIIIQCIFEQLTKSSLESNSVIY